jgi:hypothetical protein
MSYRDVWECPEGCPRLPVYEKGHWGDPQYLLGHECPDDLLGDEPCSLGIILEGVDKSMKKKGGLAARYQYSHETKDTGNSNPAFDWRSVGKEIKFFKPTKGKNSINIIPFEIKSKNHPLVKSGVMEIGDLDCVMDYYVHKGIGPSSADVICLKKNFSKPCPICEELEEMKQKGNAKQKEQDELKPKRRVLYNVIDLDNPRLGVQVFDASHFNFEKELIEEARAQSDDQEMLDYADPEDGRIISFRAQPAKFEGREFFEFKSFHFSKREEESEEVTKADLKDAISFDQIMKVYTYEQIQKILYGSEEEEEERETPPARNLDEESDEPESTSSKGTGKKDSEPEPDKKEKSKERGKDRDSSKEKEEPKEKSKEKDKSATDKCPHEHKWGKDNDEFEECDKCELWDACARANRNK